MASFANFFRKAMMGASVFLACTGFAVADDYYKGKTIRIVVGFGPGGGYDFYARLLAAHIGKHIPGNPNVLVENMPGAGSMTAANYVYAVAPKDGTVIATVDQTIPLHQLLGGAGAEFRTADLQWIGSLAHSNSVLYAWRTSGFETLADARNRQMTLGATSVASDAYIYPTLFNAILGSKFHVVLGYPDSRSIDAAMLQGEVAGNGATSWLSLLSNHKDWIDTKKIGVLLQAGIEKERDLPDVPLLSDLVTDPESRAIADLLSVSTAISDAYWTAPGVPADRLSILRTAFKETIMNPEISQEALRLKSEVRAQTGEELGRRVARIAGTPQTTLDKASRILGMQK